MRMALRLCSSRMLYFTLAPNTGMSVNKTHELSHNLLLQTHSPHFSPSPSISAPLSMFRSIETRTCVLPYPTVLTNAARTQPDEPTAHPASYDSLGRCQRTVSLCQLSA